jgi:outer membrane protein assembly factor BamE (lipoprotein component of BamABCDE complex)
MRTLAIVLAAMLAGCSTAHKMNRISLGMTKSQVIDEMGNPDSVQAEEGWEALFYNLSHEMMGMTTEYAVVLKDGKVAKYGKKWDLHQPAPKKVVIESNTPAQPAVMVGD